MNLSGLLTYTGQVAKDKLRHAGKSKYGMGAT